MIVSHVGSFQLDTRFNLFRLNVTNKRLILELVIGELSTITFYEVTSLSLTVQSLR